MLLTLSHNLEQPPPPMLLGMVGNMYKITCGSETGTNRAYERMWVEGLCPQAASAPVNP